MFGLGKSETRVKNFLNQQWEESVVAMRSCTDQLRYGNKDMHRCLRVVGKKVLMALRFDDEGKGFILRPSNDTNLVVL